MEGVNSSRSVFRACFANLLPVAIMKINREVYIFFQILSDCYKKLGK